MIGKSENEFEPKKKKSKSQFLQYGENRPSSLYKELLTDTVNRTPNKRGEPIPDRSSEQT